jgi:hypothetical protein
MSMARDAITAKQVRAGSACPRETLASAARTRIADSVVVPRLDQAAQIAVNGCTKGQRRAASGFLKSRDLSWSARDILGRRQDNEIAQSQ